MTSNQNARARFCEAADELFSENEQVYAAAETMLMTALKAANGEGAVAEDLLHAAQEFIAAALGYMRSGSPAQPILDRRPGCNDNPGAKSG